MTHMVFIENWVGDLVAINHYCSDSCARTDKQYNGWNGALETEQRQYCANCGVIIGGIDEPCNHCYPVLVNLIGPVGDEYCEHGQLVRTKVERNVPRDNQ